MHRFLAALTALVFLPGFGSGERYFAPGADLWERWAAHDETSATTVDHAVWDRLLSRYVRSDEAGVSRVAYVDFSDEDRTALDAYLARLSSTPVSGLSRDEQLAYWINFYNALTVAVVLEHYPVESIRDINISPGLFAIGPWDKQLVTVEGEPISLNDIEHRILRPIWRDARIHYVLNCASVGCPNLRADAYSADDIEQSLNAAATSYVNDPRGVMIMDGKVTVSRIYDWFIEDFGADEAGVIDHLIQFAASELVEKLTNAGSLSDTQYDWSLNAAK